VIRTSSAMSGFGHQRQKSAPAISARGSNSVLSDWNRGLKSRPRVEQPPGHGSNFIKSDHRITGGCPIDRPA
jgi:hypothetical protein